MIFNNCKNCGMILPVEEITYNVCIQNNNIKEYKEVCQRCYHTILNENKNKSNLLMENL